MITDVTTVRLQEISAVDSQIGPVSAVRALPVYTRWGAISAGAISAMAIQATLTILGVAIGLSVAGAGDPSTEGMSLGAAIWWFVTGLISLGIGGAVAGYLASTPNVCIRSMHGFLAWCVVNVVSAVLLLTAGSAALGALGASTGMVNPLQFSTLRSYNAARPNVINTAAPRFPAGAIGDDTNATGANVSESQDALAANLEDASDTSIGAAWWTLAALVLGAGAATLGGSIGGRYVPDLTGRRVYTRAAAPMHDRHAT